MWVIVFQFRLLTLHRCKLLIQITASSFPQKWVNTSLQRWIHEVFLFLLKFSVIDCFSIQIADILSLKIINTSHRIQLFHEKGWIQSGVATFPIVVFMPSAQSISQSNFLASTFLSFFILFIWLLSYSYLHCCYRSRQGMKWRKPDKFRYVPTKANSYIWIYTNINGTMLSYGRRRSDVM